MRSHDRDGVAYELVTFDLDGTLVDTAGEIAEAVNRTLADHRVAPRAELEIERLIGAGTHELLRRLMAGVLREEPHLAGRVSIDAMLVDLDAHYAATAGTAARAYDDAHETLERLQRDGVRLACVTNKERRHADRVLRAAGLDAFFPLVVGGDSLPEKKPHASVLHHVAAQLGAHARRAAHVGDSAIDVAAARNARFAAWAVPWGYNAGVPVAEARPDRMFDALADIATHVIATRRLPCPAR